jgi:hypothetical protein
MATGDAEEDGRGRKKGGVGAIRSHDSHAIQSRALSSAFFLFHVCSTITLKSYVRGDHCPC